MTFPRILGSLLCTILSFSTYAQLDFNWAIQVGSIDSDFPSSLLSDSQGNLYALCEYVDTTDLDPGPYTDIVFPTSSNPLVISKFESSGQYLWSTILFDAGNLSGEIFENKNDHFLMAGMFKDSLVQVLQNVSYSLAKNPGQNGYILQFDRDGYISSLFTYPASDIFYFTAMITFEDGGYLAAGSFLDTLILYPGISSEIKISKGGYDAFFARFDQDHHLLWIKTIGSESDEYVEDFYYAEGPNAYFTMVHDTTLTISTVGGDQTFTANGKDNNIYGMISLDGEFSQLNSFGGELGDQLRSIIPDKAGNIYIAGYFNGEVNFAHPTEAPVMYQSAGEEDGFIAKYNSSGSLVWTRIIKDTDYGGVYTMSLERSDHLYLTGGFTMKADLDPGPDSIIVETNSRTDIYAMKLNLDGDLEWVYTFPGNDYEGIRNLVLGKDGKVFIEGYFYDSLDCDPGADQTLFVSYGGSDFFMIGFTEEGVMTNTNQGEIINTLLYPNPVKDELRISSATPVESILIYTMAGLPILELTSLNTSINKINLADFPSGVYLIKIQSGENSFISKVVKL